MNPTNTDWSVLSLQKKVDALAYEIQKPVS